MGEGLPAGGGRRRGGGVNVKDKWKVEKKEKVGKGRLGRAERRIAEG